MNIDRIFDILSIYTLIRTTKYIKFEHYMTCETGGALNAAHVIAGGR